MIKYLKFSQLSKFTKKQILYYFAFFGVVIFLFTVLLHYYIQNTSLEISKLHQKELANKTVKQLETFLDEMDKRNSRKMLKIKSC